MMLNKASYFFMCYELMEKFCEAAEPTKFGAQRLLDTVEQVDIKPCTRAGMTN